MDYAPWGKGTQLGHVLNGSLAVIPDLSHEAGFGPAELVGVELISKLIIWNKSACLAEYGLNRSDVHFTMSRHG